MAKKYAGKAQFLIVYIKEAHPSDDWASKVRSDLAYIKDPTNLFERSQVAATCMSDLEINIPCVIDDMENTSARAYRGWPDRLFIVGTDGKLAYVGGPGPFGFLPGEMEKALKKELGPRP
jgi:type I thyroxine 5'-deiodinase